MATAQLPSSQLTSVFPAGAKAGSTVATKLAGTDLEEAVLRFTHAGISAKADAKDVKKQTISVAADVQVGLYEVRVIGAYGSSNPRLFQVGTLPELAGTDKNTARDAAQEAVWPCVINGTVASQAEHWFRITAKREQHLLLHCWAEELDSKLVPSLALFDAAGRQLAQVARHGVLEWDSTADGPLLVRLNDFLFKGGGEYFYRLEIGIKPAARTPPPLLWPLPVNAQPEIEPNDLAHGTNISPPSEISGSFAPARDVDVFTFQAHKGDAWWIEVISQRLGQPTDPRLVVQRIDTGKDQDVLELNDGPTTPGAPDFDASHQDPVGRFEAKEDGQYRLVVRDLNNTGSALAERRYHLSIRKEAPDFALVAIAVPPKDNTAGKDFTGPNVTVCGNTVRPGQTLPMRVLVLRRDGFQGEIKLRAEGLPSGLTSSESVISGDTQETFIFITAAANAAPWTGAIKVTGTAILAGKEAKHEARGATTLWNLTNDFIEPARSRLTQEIVLSVAKDLTFPVIVTPVETVVTATTKTKAKVNVTVARTADGKEAIKLKPAGILGSEKQKDFDIVAGADKGEYELDVPALKLKPGTYTLWFKGTIKAKLPVKGQVKEVTPSVYSTPVIVKITE